MNFGFIHITLFVLVKLVSVKSECDSYFGCLHQFYDGFFGSTVNFKTTETQVGDIEIPGFKNINLESDNVDSILKTVTGFLKDLVGDFDSKSQINVLHNNNNKTFIFVKAINIAGDFDNFDDVNNAVKNETGINNLSGIEILTSTKQNSDLSSTEHINGITPKSISNSTNNTKTVNIQNPILDINELSKIVKENEIIDIDSYDYINENSTDYPIIDYIDLYKDTTNEYVEIKPTTVSTYDINEFEKKTTPYNNIMNVSTFKRVYTEECTNATDAIFPFVVAIFVKNETGNQFYYYCDGALLSDTVIITAASCIQTPNATSEDLLVILGKRSLKVTSENEIIAKIKDVHIYNNFTESENNIALLVMNVPVALSDRVEPARLGDAGDESATTGWAISGELTVIPFEVEKDDCNDLTLNTFCATYGNDVSVCPSYGGLYVTRQSNDWFLRGIRADKPTNNSLCVDRTVIYTDLKYYSIWINLYV